MSISFLYIMRGILFYWRPFLQSFFKLVTYWFTRLILPMYIYSKVILLYFYTYFFRDILVYLYYLFLELRILFFRIILDVIGFIVFRKYIDSNLNSVSKDSSIYNIFLSQYCTANYFNKILLLNWAQTFNVYSWLIEDIAYLNLGQPFWWRIPKPIFSLQLRENFAMFYLAIGELLGYSFSAISYSNIIVNLLLKWNFINPFIADLFFRYIFVHNEDLILEYLWLNKYFKKYFSII